MAKTVEEIVKYPHQRQQIKHDLGEHYTQNQINGMTNMQFLEAISEAIEERLAAQPDTTERQIADELEQSDSEEL